MNIDRNETHDRMNIDLNKTQASMIQELLLANALTPNAIGQARELFNQCQQVREEPEDAPGPDQS